MLPPLPISRISRALLLGLLLPALALAQEPAPPVVVGYLPHYRAETWSPERIGPVTDLILFAIEPRADGSLDVSNITPRLLEKAQAARERNGCRLLVCCGGWGRSDGFSKATADEATRRKLVENLIAFCRKHELDGIDFDWEHPEGAAQRAAYTALIVETARAAAEDERIVTVAVAPWVDIGKEAYRAAARVHLMSYDHAFPQATLEKSRKDVERVIGYGCPREKIALGIPFYGRDEARRAKTYAQLVDEQTDASSDRIDGYAFNGPDTVRAKLAFARDAGLAGLMIWELGQDARDKERSLLHAIDEEIGE